jgi:ATP-dependent DNA ligase
MPQTRKRTRKKPIAEGAVPADELRGGFPKLGLPIQPPFPPMEAKSAADIPEGGFQYEPKWDGFRCLAFRSGDTVAMQSKAGQPLGRYFPELLDALLALPSRQFVLDGEIVIERDGELSFDDLLMRIHPAESRIRRLAAETPGMLLVFDILVDEISFAKTEGGQSLINMPLAERRKRLVDFFERVSTGARIKISPATQTLATAQQWMNAPRGMDGVIAKLASATYASGERTAMMKIKRLRTADCVVGGFRWSSEGDEVGSLLLGLYDADHRLHHVGFTSSFREERRHDLRELLLPFMGGAGFSGRAPGGPSRWSTERTGKWEKLDPRLVCEVQYDHFSGDRFRHGTKFLRWRPEKKPQQCTFEQVRPRIQKAA